MSNSSLYDCYAELIEKIIQTTLKGQIRSKEQVYKMLLKEIKNGTGEIFERSLNDRLNNAQSQFNRAADELRKAKAERIIRALQTIVSQWSRWLQENASHETIATAVKKILTAEPDRILLTFTEAIDPNQTEILNPNQLQQIAKAIAQEIDLIDDRHPQKQILTSIATGMLKGLQSWQELQHHLISWVYIDQSESGNLGYEGKNTQGKDPWQLWAKNSSSDLPKQLFITLAASNSVAEMVIGKISLDVSAWVELALILQYLPRNLVVWFDKQPYDSKWGIKLSIATYISFASIWCQLSDGLARSSALTSDECTQLSESSFQLMLQLLRAFSQKPYFPLYGGIFASLTGEYLQDTLNYLDEPLKAVAGTQEKARILTLLGYSQRAIGQYDRAIAFHQEALKIARQAEDSCCEIANLNHLSRTYIAQKNYPEAINYSQRALILARSLGDTNGKANAMVNLGNSEVRAARELDRMDAEIYERAIDYLQQGLKLSEQLEDRQSQAFAYNSLGIAHILLEQPQKALRYLEKAAQAIQFSGDLYLKALNFAYFAEAYYGLKDLENTIYAGCIGMYLLEQIAAIEWRQVAGLLTILQGQIGIETWQNVLTANRAKTIAMIGVDGYDYLPNLLNKYREII